MSTTTQRMIGERKFLTFLLDNYKKDILDGFKFTNENSIWEMFEEGYVQIESILENAISKIGHIERNSINRMDFVDGSDSKKCTLSKEKKGNNTRYYYRITNAYTKVGKLRIMGWNWKADRFEFFVIPKFVYQGLKHVKISVDNQTFIPVGKYSKWQVNSFEAMCCL